MATTIKTKNSTTAATAPTGLVQGELAVNITDKKLYVGDSVGNSIQIAGAGATNAAGGSNTQVQYNSSGALAGSANMTFDGTTLTAAGLSGPHNGTVGATTPNTGAFTTLSASGAFSANGGATLGDASGDALTINSSAVSIPNGLNFDSNTFVIDATNNRVGVGTASPSVPLDVAGITQSTKFIPTAGSATGVGMYLPSTNVLAFSTNDTERVRITATGNLLVNSTGATNYRLLVNRGSAGDIAQFTDGVAQTFAIKSDASGIILDAPNNSYQSFNTNGSERMRITSTGNVGIGTSSPYGSTTVRGLTVTGSNNGSFYAEGGITLSGYSPASYYFYNSAASTNKDGAYISAINNGAITSYATTNLVFGTRNGATIADKMTLDSSGNLGLGVTPSAWGSTTKSIDINTGAAIYAFAGNSVGLSSNAYYNGTNWIYKTTNASALYAATSGVHAWYNAASGTAGNAITFTQAMTLDTSGNLMVGTTTLAGNGFTMYPNGSGGGIYTVYNRPATSSTTTALDFKDGGTTKGSISYTNTATSFNTSSDYRLKENVAPMTGALAKNALLKPVTYTWKADGSAGEGFIAHELAEVMPQAVTGEKDAVNEDGSIKPQGIDTSFLVGHLVACIQELKAEVDSLKAQLNK